MHLFISFDSELTYTPQLRHHHRTRKVGQEKNRPCVCNPFALNPVLSGFLHTDLDCNAAAAVCLHNENAFVYQLDGGQAGRTTPVVFIPRRFFAVCLIFARLI